MSRLREKTTATLLIAIFLFSIVVPISFANPGRFDGLTYVYRVETQTQVDALPKIIDAAAAGKDIGILVVGSGITLDGFKITGSTADPNDYCIDVEGQTDVTVSNCLLIEGWVSLYYYASSGSIVHNEVYGYMKNGITANMPSSDGSIVKIKWNTVTGRGDIDYIAQNGIQIGYGSTGVIMFNTVENHWYTGADWGSSGILIFESDECNVHGNEILHNQMGVAIESWCWLRPSASKNKVVRNTIKDGQVGVSVASYAWQYSTGDCMTDNNKIVNNVIESQDDYGISIGAWYIIGAYSASAFNNKAIHNTFVDIDQGLEISDDGTATKIHANVFP